MKLLLVNPNISDSVCDLIRTGALRSASPGTQVEVVTARSGVAYIETRFEALLGAHTAAQLTAERRDAREARGGPRPWGSFSGAPEKPHAGLSPELVRLLEAARPAAQD